MMTQSIIFNFHRVSDDFDISTNPFNYFSNISNTQFRIFIKIIQLNASFKSLDELLRNAPQKNPIRSSVHLTFDDVSSSFVKSVLPLMEKKKISVTIFPSISNTDKGYSWRDKIYFIMSKPELCSSFVERMRNVFGGSVNINEKNIFSYSKDPIFNQKILEEEVVNDVMKAYLDTFNNKVAQFKPYLDWADLSKLQKHPLITIGNHGFSHYNYLSLCEDEIKDDIQKSHILLKKNLGMKCRHFAVPFGSINHRVLRILETTLSKFGYETVGWVRSRSNTNPRKSVLKHYIRIDGGQSALINYLKYWRIRLNKTKTVF